MFDGIELTKAQKTGVGVFLAALGVATAGSAMAGYDAFTLARQLVRISRHDAPIAG